MKLGAGATARTAFHLGVCTISHGYTANVRRESTSARLRLTLDMFKVGLALKEAQFRRANPGISEREIVAKLKAWLADKPPPGEGPLRRIKWPRSKKSSSSRSAKR